MNPVAVATGMHVRDVRGREVGAVTRVNACCFVVTTTHGEELAVTAAPLIGAESGRIELICDMDQLDRYACGMHRAAQRTHQ